MHTRAISDLATSGRLISGKYRLESMIGQGGMGSVWAATHLGLNTQVAIKLVSRELIRSPEALRRFDAEAKAVAKLQSRHVVQVYDNGALEDGTPYVVMEFLQGEDLGKLIARGGPLPLPEAAAILVQCAKALARAHSVGIVHRDVKPDNIFLAASADEDATVAKVLDFGIAKVASAEGDVHSSTRTGAVLGTPLYMSPEQARGLKSVDHRTDIYSLGLVAYSMLTGKLAFSGESFGDLLVQICTQELPSLLAGAPWLSAGMEGWFQRACARDPGNRFQSMQDFVAGLRAAAGGPVADLIGANASDRLGGPASAMVGVVAAPPAEGAHGSAGTDLSMHAGPPRRNGRIGLRVVLPMTLVAAAAVVAVVSQQRAAAPASSETSTAPASSAASVPTVVSPSSVAPVGDHAVAAATLGEAARLSAASVSPAAAPPSADAAVPHPPARAPHVIGAAAVTSNRVAPPPPTTNTGRSVDLGY